MKLDRRLLRLAQSHPWLLGGSILLGFGAGLAALAQAYLLSRLIGEAFLGGSGIPALGDLPALFVGVIVLRAGFSWAGDAVAAQLATVVKHSLRTRLYAHILKLGPAFTREERTGELAGAVLEGIEDLDGYFSQYLPQLVLALVIPLIFLAFVFPLDPLSGLVLLLTGPLIPVFMMLIGSMAQAATRRRWRTLSLTGAYFLDVLQGLTTLKILGRSRAQVKVVQAVSERFGKATLGVLRVTFLSALALELIATLSTAVVAVEVGLRLLYGRLAFEQAFFILLLAPEFYQPLRLLGARFHAGMAGVEAAQRIFAILETHPPEPSAPQKQSPALEPPFEIAFQKVSYHYPDARSALEEISLRLPAGKITALVGPTGAGKSTLANLLLRFQAPQAGQIMVNGQDLAAIPVEVWRDRLAWVPQRPHLFHDTIATNLRLARPQAHQDELESAARAAGLHDFIISLPEGYQTVIGERGARLSAGQAQRLALARAFLKDAPLVVLDEATANLDPVLETQIVASVRRLLAGRTALVIAHRLNTIVQADQIVVLEAGRVVESGAHPDLLTRNGLYARLVGSNRDANKLVEDEIPVTFQAGENTEIRSTYPLPPVSIVEPQAGPIRLSSVFRRLLSFVRSFAGQIALTAGLGFATVASSIGLLAASAYLISAAALHPSIADLQVAIVSVRFFGIARGLFRYLERYSSHQVTFRLLARLRVWFFQAIEPLAPARLMDYRSGDLLGRVMVDIEALDNFYVRALAPPLTALLVILAVTGYLAGFAPLLGIVTLGMLLLAGAGVPAVALRMGRSPGSRIVAARAELRSTLVDGIQGLADLLVYGQGQAQVHAIEASGRELERGYLRLARTKALQAALVNLLGNLTLFAVVILAIPLVQSGRFSGVYLAVVGLAALASFEAVQPLPVAAQYLESNLQAARRLFEIIDARPEVAEPDQPAGIPSETPPAVEFKGVSFSYPQPASGQVASHRYALRDISFRLEPGQRTAVVGPSGAGKTSLANLLLRFWEADSGRITLGGVDLAKLRSEEVRRRMILVSQDTYIFNASVQENLLIARPEVTQEELIQAARAAQIHEFIESLPQGYETWTGEHGLRLSGGERQRLAIARALLKDAPVLILDEPTGNLDPETERRLLASLYALMAGRTTLLITHRLVGMEQMDQILVMNQGEIVERGTHAGLLARRGLYWRMYNLQNLALSETEI